MGFSFGVEGLRNILLPGTDAGVVMQLGTVAVVWIGILWLTRDRREVRLVVVGAGLVLIGLIGVRALH